MGGWYFAAFLLGILFALGVRWAHLWLTASYKRQGQLEAQAEFKRLHSSTVRDPPSGGTT